MPSAIDVSLLLSRDWVFDKIAVEQGIRCARRGVVFTPAYI
jgi:hypothetical protein